MDELAREAPLLLQLNNRPPSLLLCSLGFSPSSLFFFKPKKTFILSLMKVIPRWILRTGLVLFPAVDPPLVPPPFGVSSRLSTLHAWRMRLSVLILWSATAKNVPAARPVFRMRSSPPSRFVSFPRKNKLPCFHSLSPFSLARPATALSAPPPPPVHCPACETFFPAFFFSQKRGSFFPRYEIGYLALL